MPFTAKGKSITNKLPKVPLKDFMFLIEAVDETSSLTNWFTNSDPCSPSLSSTPAISAEPNELKTLKFCLAAGKYLAVSPRSRKQYSQRCRWMCPNVELGKSAFQSSWASSFPSLVPPQ